MTLPEIVAQLRACGYECEAGRLEFNVAFQALVEMAEQELKEVSALTPSTEHIPAQFLAVEQRRYCPRCGVAFLNVEGDCPVCHYRFMAAMFGRQMSELIEKEKGRMEAGVKSKRFRAIFGNYFPREVDSTLPTRELAQARADELNEEHDTSMWEVEEV